VIIFCCLQTAQCESAFRLTTKTTHSVQDMLSNMWSSSAVYKQHSVNRPLDPQQQRQLTTFKLACLVWAGSFDIKTQNSTMEHNHQLRLWLQLRDAESSLLAGFWFPAKPWTPRRGPLTPVKTIIGSQSAGLSLARDSCELKRNEKPMKRHNVIITCKSEFSAVNQ